jgi:energy-coupling factor transporter ATP-binding protein EcfA2
VAHIEIYIGSLIEHHSERRTLLELVKSLHALSADAVIIANAELSGRQIDFILALDQATFVIESKTAHQPLRGGPNGDWQYQSAAGGWKDMANPYRQALGEVNAVRDAMNAFTSGAPYPFGLLVYSPNIPPASSISDDFKVSVIGLDDIASVLQWRKDTHWTLGQWRQFIATHKFKRITRPEAAFDHAIADAESLFTIYHRNFLDTYGSFSADLISYECRNGSSAISLDEAILKAAKGSNIFLTGPSGCGKSLAAYKIGVLALTHGRLPILVSGKHFNGSFGDLIKAEVGLLGILSWAEFLRAQQNLEFPLLIVIDGYNECPQGLSDRFTRGIAAMARRYDASIAITGQVSLNDQSLLVLDTIYLPSPDLATKVAIASRASNYIEPHLSELLRSVSTGLEARLIGEVGATLPAGSSRFVLFDMFARKALGRDATECITALTRLAAYLTENVAFGLSVRELDRYSVSNQIRTAVFEYAHNARFLNTRGDRVTFSHELFQDAFVAESVMRRCASAFDILNALSEPQNRSRQVLIVGAIENDRVLTDVIEGITSSSLLDECAGGACGLLAKNIAQRLLLETLTHVSAEIAQLECVLDKSAMGGVRFNTNDDFQWEPTERARLGAIALRLRDGHEIEKVFAAIGQMDRVITREARRLREDAIALEIAPRHGMFSNVYVFSGSTGVGQICQPIHSGMGRVTKNAETKILEMLRSEDLTNGQLYLLLAMHRATELDAPGIAGALPALINRHWKGAPYHLKLDILMAATFCARDDDKEKKELLKTLQELPPPDHIFLSTSYVEALQSLGGFDDQEQEFLEMAQSDLEEALKDSNNPNMHMRANGAWNQQFDGPYSGAYCQAIGELEPDKKKQLLIMAAKGAGKEDSFSNILIFELAHFNEMSLGPLIFKWIELPPKRCVMPQEAIRNFATAHVALAKLKVDLPPSNVVLVSDSANALMSCGQILYWMNREDLPVDDRRTMCRPMIQQLLRHELGVSASVLSEFYNADLRFSDKGSYSLPGSESIRDCIGTEFPTEVAEISRTCLSNPDIQNGFFDHFEKGRPLEFSQNALGAWGERGDLALLRANANDKRLSFSALSAIEKLEAYLSSPPDSPRPHFSNARTFC